MLRQSFFRAVFLSVFLVAYLGAFSLADQLDGGSRACPPCNDDGSEISRLLQKADALYDSFKTEEALQELFKVLRMDPENHGALSRASRAYIDIGDMIPETTPDWQKKRLKQYAIAEEYARKAVKADPDSTWGHFYVAASLGKIALLSPISKQIELSREIRWQAEKAIALDPQNGFAYHVYGIWHREMAQIGQMKRMLAAVWYWDPIPKGTLQKSEEYLKKAISLNPTVIVSHWELAKTYMAMQKWELARRSLKTVLRLPIQFSDDHLHKKNAEKLLQEIRDR
jgi:tetratricopeptide (TPR) repeat protein